MTNAERVHATREELYYSLGFLWIVLTFTLLGVNSETAWSVLRVVTAGIGLGYLVSAARLRAGGNK